MYIGPIKTEGFKVSDIYEINDCNLAKGIVSFLVTHNDLNPHHIISEALKAILRLWLKPELDEEISNPIVMENHLNELGIYQARRIKFSEVEMMNVIKVLIETNVINDDDIKNAIRQINLMEETDYDFMMESCGF